MGYSEILCHICGVSFNIGRIRTPNEPRSAAWSRWGPIQSKVHVVDNPDSRHMIYNSYVRGGRNSWIGECHRDAGCMFTLRKVKDEHRGITVSRRGRRKLAGGKELVEEEEGEDRDWEESKEEEEDEPLEYASDVEEELEERSDVEMEDVDDTSNDAAQREEIRRFWIDAMTTYNESQSQFGPNNPSHPAWYRGYFTVERFDEVHDEMFPLFYPGKDGETEYGTDGSMDSDDGGSSPGSRRLNHYLGGKLGYYTEQQYEVEHISGPGCLNRDGYSGHEISVEEMRNCQVSQCLVRKPRGWKFEPLENDEEFEKSGAFFLSGLSDYMPSRDDRHPRAQPVRHGCEQPHAENYMFDIDTLEDYAMPFHPSCFEIFKRASVLELGTIDVDGLTSWWTQDAEDQTFLFRDADDNDVHKCKEQEWNHWKGTAYLAANPLYVPKLRELLPKTISTSPEFSPRDGAFHIAENSILNTSSDPFARLPAELQFTILDNLRSQDIASLRLASRSFRQLPISYFQKLLYREMPWLWEAWPTPAKPYIMPYSFWATVTASEAERKLGKTQKTIAGLQDYVEIISAEMPELQSVLEEALPTEIQAVLDAHQLEIDNDEDRKPFFLPPNRTNYYLLYVLVKRHWGELQGLQNRRRIWTECVDISRGIKSMREDGAVEPLER